MMKCLFDQEEVERMAKISAKREGWEEGRLEGRQEGRLETMIEMFQSFEQTLDETIAAVSKKFGYSEEKSRNQVLQYWK